MSYTPYLCTLAQLNTAAKVTVTNINDVLLSVIKEASARVEAYKQCEFEPLHETRYADAQGDLIVDSGRTLLLKRPLLAITSITLGDGTELETTDYILSPRGQSPATAIILTRASGYTWTTWTDDWLDAIEIEAVWGYHDDYTGAWVATSALAEDVDASETAVDVTTGQGARFSPGMLIRFGASGDYARITAVSTDTLTVERGQNGTTAATHLTGVAVYYWRPMTLVQTAAAKWAAYAFTRLGAFDQVAYDGIATVSFPPDIPGMVRGALDSFYNFKVWRTP